MTTSWTDVGASSPSARVDGTVSVRAIHINELKTAIDAERARRSAPVYSWTDFPVVANSTLIRETHITQLRNAVPVGYNCSTDYAGNPPWYTADDPAISANSTRVRFVHINDLRAYVNTEEATCLCYCNFNCGNNGQCNDN